tara:strand:- start:1013 stop:3202 length:2190 start_codon:yes stop_codon:yes gene_type:complete
MRNNKGISFSPVASLDKAPKTEDDYLNFGEDVWSYLSGSRGGIERNIKEALHMLGGNQWIKYSPNSARFDHHTLDDWVPTPVTNYLVRNFDRIVDIFITGDIMPNVDPATRNQDDIEAARTAQHVLQSEFHRLSTDLNLHIPAAGWLVLSGNAILYTGWDAKAGDKMRQPRMGLDKKEVTQEVMNCATCGYQEPADRAPERCPNCYEKPFLESSQEPVYDMSGQKSYDTTEVPERDKDGYPVYDEYSVGNLTESVINPLNWYPQPARSFRDVRYVMETDPMDVDQIKDKFGSKAKDLVAESLDYENWTGVFDHQNDGSGQDDTKDKVLLKFFRHVPDRRFKNGCLLIYANGKVLYKGDLDSCDGNLPYTHIKYRDMPGLFWGGSPFSDMVPLQKRINAVDSHIVQNRKQMVSNQWLVPEGAGVSHVDGRAGLIIRYNPHTTGGFKPERLQGVPVSAQVLQERDSTLRDMDEVSGAREILQGGIPPGGSGLETGAAVELVQEQAFKRFGPAIKAWRAGLSEHEHRKLLIIHKYWKESRLIKNIGDNKETESFHFTGADVYRAEDMTVKVGIGANYSDVAYQQKIMKAAQLGVLGDIKQPQVRGRVLEALGIDGFEGEYVLDAKKARRVLTAIRDGAGPEDLPEILEIDNHQIQYGVLREFMLTSEFEKMDEGPKQALMQRAQQHRQVIEQEQQKAMQAAQAAKGAPDQAAEGIAQSGAMGPQQSQQNAQQ